MENLDDIPLTVVIPAYNAQDYIAETLSSLRAVTGVRFSTIVVDDGSSDDTAQIVASFPEVVLHRKGTVRNFQSG